MNWSQLKTILWLRWRLTCNASFKRSNIAGVFLIVLSILGVASAVGVFFGATFAGYRLLNKVTPDVLQTIWTMSVVVFLVIWLLGLLTELQRSETIDLPRLLHLPVQLGQVFLINYIASHAVFSIVMWVPSMIGLALGLSASRSPGFLLLIPLTLSTVFMISAWTYCLRGWLAGLMSNPRRRRTITMLIPLVFIVIGQGPNLYFNVFRRSHSTQPNATRNASSKEFSQFFGVAARILPPLWLPLGAKAIAEGNPQFALLGTLGCSALGALGLRRAYLGTLRFYRGANTSRPKPTAAPNPSETRSRSQPSPRRNRWIELQIKGLPEPASAIAGACFQSLLRAPEIKMALGSWIFVFVLLGGSLLLRTPPSIPESVKPFLILGPLAFLVTVFFQFFANQFGTDRDGFRAFILSPVDRRWLLLGKNLAWAPPIALFGLLLIVSTAYWFRIPLDAALAGFFQLVSMFLIAVSLGNVVSSLLPFRLQANAMKASKPPFLKLLGLLLAQAIFTLALTPIAFPAALEWLWRRTHPDSALPINLLLSIVLSGIALAAYSFALQPIAQFYSQRELNILKSVTTTED